MKNAEGGFLLVYACFTLPLYLFSNHDVFFQSVHTKVTFACRRGLSEILSSIVAVFALVMTSAYNFFRSFHENSENLYTSKS